MATATRPDASLRTAAPPRAAVVWTALGLVYVVWGSTYLAIRIVVQAGMPPLVAGGLRFATASVVLAAALAARRGPRHLRVSPRQLGSAALVGTLLLFGGNGFVTLAEQTVPSGLAALLVAGVPLWVVVLRAVTRDRPRGATVAGVGLGLLGLAVLVLPGGDTTGAQPWGVALVVLATLSWSVGSFISRRLPMPDDPFVATVWEMLAGGSIMLLVGVGRGELTTHPLGSAEAAGWWGLAYLVAFGSLVAFTAYVWLLKSAPLSLVATYAYVNPVVAVFLGALLLDEPVTAAILVGGGIVVAGVGIVVTTERPRPAVTEKCEPAG